MKTYGKTYEIRISEWSGDLEAFRGYEFGDAAGMDGSELLDVYNDRDEAIWFMENSVNRINVIHVMSSGVHVNEAELFSFPLDEHGLVADYDDPWVPEFRCERTAVYVDNSDRASSPTIFNSFTEAQTYALEIIDQRRRAAKEIKLKDLIPILDAEDGIELYCGGEMIERFDMPDEIGIQYYDRTVIYLNVCCYQAVIELEREV